MFPVSSEEQIAECIDNVKKLHYNARHWCYAWQLGTKLVRYRANDDGEPNNSAGQPIYGQILSFGLTNVLVVVVRYFGGVKLGVGGLINAYKTTAKMVLEEARIITKTINVHFRLNFEYEYMNKVMRIIKLYEVDLLTQKMEMNCEFTISIRLQKADELERQFAQLRHVKVKRLEV